MAKLLIKPAVTSESLAKIKSMDNVYLPNAGNITEVHTTVANRYVILACLAPKYSVELLDDHDLPSDIYIPVEELREQFTLSHVFCDLRSAFDVVNLLS